MHHVKHSSSLKTTPCSNFLYDQFDIWHRKSKALFFLWLEAGRKVCQYWRSKNFAKKQLLVYWTGGCINIIFSSCPILGMDDSARLDSTEKSYPLTWHVPTIKKSITNITIRYYQTRINNKNVNYKVCIIKTKPEKVSSLILTLTNMAGVHCAKYPRSKRKRKFSKLNYELSKWRWR